MPEVTTTASLVDYESIADEDSVVAVLERSALQAALHTESPGLWFEVGYEDEGPSRITVELSPADVEEILRLSSGDDVTLALHAAAVASLLEAPEVEGHGMRSALVIGVVAGAIAAPAGLAATPQVSPAGASAQAVTSQVSSSSVSSQVSRAAARSQVSPAALRSQVSRQTSKSQLAKSLVLKGSGVQALKKRF